MHYAGDATNGANYTWCTATAGSCSGAENNTDAKASSSICPKGWRLPTKVEYDTLKSKDGGWDSTKKGRTLGGGFFPAAGLVSDGSLIDVGSGGSYWSSTANSSNGAYRLYFSGNSMFTGIYSRYLGYSVRCIAP